MKKIEKKVYTVEEVDELKDTVAMLFEQAYICCNNPKMQGCLLLLENIKKNLEEKKGIE